MSYAAYPTGERPVPQNPLGKGWLDPASGGNRTASGSTSGPTGAYLSTAYAPIALYSAAAITYAACDNTLERGETYTTLAPAEITLPAGLTLWVESTSPITYDRSPAAFPATGPLG